MIDFFQRVVNARDLPPLPDDDVTVEERYPRFRFSTHPRMRKMQRKCLMRAEHMRHFPELYTHIAVADAKQTRLAAAPKPRASGPSRRAEPDDSYDFTGIEATDPARRRHGEE